MEMLRAARRLSFPDPSGVPAAAAAANEDSTTNSATMSAPRNTRTAAAKRRPSRHVRFGGDVEVHAIERKRASMVTTLFYTARDFMQFKEDKVEEEAAALQVERERQRNVKQQEKDDKKKMRKAKVAERKAKRTASSATTTTTTCTTTGTETEREPLETTTGLQEEDSESSLQSMDLHLENAKSHPPQQISDHVHDSITLQLDKRNSTLGLQKYGNSPHTSGYLPSQYRVLQVEEEDTEAYSLLESDSPMPKPNIEVSELDKLPDEEVKGLTNVSDGAVYQGSQHDSFLCLDFDAMDESMTKNDAPAKQPHPFTEYSTPTATTFATPEIVPPTETTCRELHETIIMANTDSLATRTVTDQIIHTSPTHSLGDEYIDQDTEASSFLSTDNPPSRQPTSLLHSSPCASIPALSASQESPETSLACPESPSSPFATSEPFSPGTPQSSHDPNAPLLDGFETPVTNSGPPPPPNSPACKVPPQPPCDLQLPPPPSPPSFHRTASNEKDASTRQTTAEPTVPQLHEAKMSSSGWSLSSWRNNSRTCKEREEINKNRKGRTKDKQKHKQRTHQNQCENPADHLQDGLASSNAILDPAPSRPRPPRKTSSGVLKVFSKLKAKVKGTKKHKDIRAHQESTGEDAYDWSRHTPGPQPQRQHQHESSKGSWSRNSNSSSESTQAYDWTHHQQHQRPPSPRSRNSLPSVPELPAEDPEHTNTEGEEKQEDGHGYAWEHHEHGKKAPPHRKSSFLGRLIESKTTRRARKRSEAEEDNGTRQHDKNRHLAFLESQRKEQQAGLAVR